MNYCKNSEFIKSFPVVVLVGLVTSLMSPVPVWSCVVGPQLTTPASQRGIISFITQLSLSSSPCSSPPGSALSLDIKIRFLVWPGPGWTTFLLCWLFLSSSNIVTKVFICNFQSVTNNVQIFGAKHCFLEINITKIWWRSMRDFAQTKQKGFERLQD